MSDRTDQARKKARQHEALARLRRAVAGFDVADTLQALYDCGALAGLRQRLHIRWPSFRNEHDTHHIVAKAVDALTDELENRRRVTEPVGFLWRVVERRACDEFRRRRREIPSDPRVMTGRLIPALHAAIGPAIQEARRLLPHICGENVRGALAMILNAMEQGREILPSAEIALALGVSVAHARQLRVRAFDRLLTLARADQAVGQNSNSPDVWRADEELLVAPDSGDEERHASPTAHEP